MMRSCLGWGLCIEGRTSFLKKRSKKLLALGVAWGECRLGPTDGEAGRQRRQDRAKRSKSFFASFFSKKEVLP
jgi:hypothetical protein